LTLDEIEKISV
jgi:hypothetical protein